MKEKTPLTGRESSILALIAQGGPFSTTDKKRILAHLSGRALKIAEVMFGKKTTSKSLLKAAEGFKRWAKGLTNKSHR